MEVRKRVKQDTLKAMKEIGSPPDKIINQKIRMVDNGQYSSTLLPWQPGLSGCLSSLRVCKVPAL